MRGILLPYAPFMLRISDRPGLGQPPLPPRRARHNHRASHSAGHDDVPCGAGAHAAAPSGAMPAGVSRSQREQRWCCAVKHTAQSIAAVAATLAHPSTPPYAGRTTVLEAVAGVAEPNTGGAPLSNVQSIPLQSQTREGRPCLMCSPSRCSVLWATAVHCREFLALWCA